MYFTIASEDASWFATRIEVKLRIHLLIAGQLFTALCTVGLTALGYTVVGLAICGTLPIGASVPTLIAGQVHHHHIFT